MARVLRNCLAGVTLTIVVTLCGCQTWVPQAGLTLPSPSYLDHPPQYIPRSPGFPLAKELESLERAAAQQYKGGLVP